MADDHDRHRGPIHRREPIRPLPSAAELLKLVGLNPKIRILFPSLNPREWEEAIREMGYTPEEWRASSPRQQSEPGPPDQQLPLFPDPPPRPRRELIPENNDPLNLVAKEKLAQVATPSADCLYVLQLMRWARTQGKVSLPQIPTPRELADQVLEKLLAAAPADAWRWLKRLDEPDDLPMGLDPDDLRQADPTEAADAFLERLCDLVSEAASDGADSTPEP